MTTTLANFQSGVCEEYGNLITGTTTSAGAAGGTTFIDTALALYPDDEKRLMESYFMPTSGTYAGIERQITDWVSSTTTGTTRAFAGQIASGVTYKIMPFAPSKITEKANDAIKRTRYLFRVIRDDSTATREKVSRYPVPSTIIKDPLQIWISKQSFGTQTIDACTAAWTESVDSDCTVAVDDVDYQENNSCLKFTVAAGAGAGDILATQAISTKDLSNDTGVTFAIKSSVATAAGDLQLLLDETASCASPSETLSVPALTANEWQVVTVDYAGADSDRDAVISIGLKYTTDLGACTIRLSEVKSITDLPKDSLADQEQWEQLLHWYYEADSSKVYFPYWIPANRKLRMIGKGYLSTFSVTGTFATDQASTTQADEPEISHLYALTLEYLYRDQYLRAVGSDKDEIGKNISFWVSEAEKRGQEIRLEMPRKTIKIPAFSYGGIGA
jgi:hypothetical protein